MCQYYALLLYVVKLTQAHKHIIIITYIISDIACEKCSYLTFNVYTDLLLLNVRIHIFYYFVLRYVERLVILVNH